MWSAPRDWDALTWSPDCRLLAIAGPDGGLSVWDVTKLGEPVATDGPALEKAWVTLASNDARIGFVALRTILTSEDTGVALLKSKLAAVPAVDAKRLAALLTDLTSEDFPTREAAMTELKKLGRLAAPVMRVYMKAPKSPEGAQRVGELLRLVDGAILGPDDRRVVRTVEAVVWIGTPEAEKLLKVWAGGADGALLTTKARAALERRKK
ncbi:hypothetical protein [Gemmata massiliana]|uniref:hypothetical protein n=1 Tax=Gemmata massiliana TaxID=1210884 RepID=UPI001E4E48A0|nr:hypothetical protein [Gemmata massiliana]